MSDQQKPQREAERRQFLRRVCKTARNLYGYNRALRKKWIRARLLMGAMEPRVRIGSSNVHVIFPRTLREAGVKVCEF